MEGMEFEGDEMEDIEAKDDEVELNGGINGTAVTPSSQGLTGCVDGSNLEATNHGKSHVNSVMVNVNDNCESSAISYADLPVSGSNGVNASDKGASNGLGVMPVPFIENPVLNPSLGQSNYMGNTSSKSSSDGNGGSNPWLKLNETVGNKRGNNDVELGTKGKDTVMTEKFVQNNVSFASAFKGLTGYGNNKLTKVPVRRNEQAYGRASFARVLIEVDADKELVDNVEVCYASLGRSIKLKVEYAWKPPQCLLCKVFGHDQKACNKREVSVEERVEMTKVTNDNNMKQNNSNGGDREWQEGKDTVMTEKFVQSNVSFASAFKGLTGYGNNKLTKAPVRRNEQAYGRASFARVLIEVDADKELVDNVEVCYASLGRSIKLKVEYAWKPPQCLLCKVFGHDQKACNKREVSVEERVEMTKVTNDNNMKQNNSNGGDREWQEVNRGNKDNNVVKNMNLENDGKKVDEGIILDSNNKNDKKGKGVSGSKVELKNKVNKQSDLNTKNKFDVLAKDGMDEVEIGSEEWIQMRKKIDLACDLGMKVADSEKRRWSKDLRNYYEEKCNNKAKGKMMEGLKWRIAKLQKDISYGHTNIAMQAKLKADEVCKEIMKETVLIEVDADKELVDNVEVCYASLGRSMKLKVEYAWKPPQCLLCKVFGHDQKACNKREVSVEERVEMTKVTNDNNMKQNNSNGGDREWQEVELKNKVNKQSDLNTKNKFDVLAKDGMDEVEIGSEEWIQMRKKIDLACDLGMTVADSEKRRWSKDLRNYYEEKCNNKAKGKMIEGLKWRIAKLQKDISYGHTNIAMQAKLKADEVCKEIMKETGSMVILVSGCATPFSLLLLMMQYGNRVAITSCCEAVDVDNA
ncbi:zinc knuckle CX2CX4HX4C [Artemisia annua]|uniref:Zinc knuckle CX2CX4HX4C n=1 Tax=Artemisia annua TaxID=35608 RepID=A0A2U1M426_ARTAN|nr:zinc knuckle CX2CX4HX4C [Artemisia annua]